MTDRELLEYAAKAAGILIIGMHAINGVETGRLMTTKGSWNPLTDDGDALRLAVKLSLKLSIWSDCGGVSCAVSDVEDDGKKWIFQQGADQYADARRAIVRVAAEIGKAMP